MRPDKFTQKMQEALQAAQEVAAQFSQQEISNEHFLLALLDQADGVTRPVIAVRLTDRDGRLAHHGITGDFVVPAPYAPAVEVDAQAARQLAGLCLRGCSVAWWGVAGHRLAMRARPPALSRNRTLADRRPPPLRSPSSQRHVE